MEERKVELIKSLTTFLFDAFVADPVARPVSVLRAYLSWRNLIGKTKRRRKCRGISQVRYDRTSENAAPMKLNWPLSCWAAAIELLKLEVVLKICVYVHGTMRSWSGQICLLHYADLSSLKTQLWKNTGCIMLISVEELFRWLKCRMIAIFVSICDYFSASQSDVPHSASQANVTFFPDGSLLSVADMLRALMSP